MRRNGVRQNGVKRRGGAARWARALGGNSRQGSTILVVIALLGLLSLLGVLFYTFAAQEKNSAEFYSDAAKDREPAEIDVDTLMNWGLQQLIVGPDQRLFNSALWGSRHSMVPNMLGRNMQHQAADLHPYTGQGVNVITSGTGPVVDQDFDGNDDFTGGMENFSWLNFNDSPAAQSFHYENDILGSAMPTDQVFDRFEFAQRRDISIPQPDVDYTYPDINNLFLSYNGFTFNPSTNEVRRVIIPSFHRPQYLRSGTGPLANWHELDSTTSRVMRPHPNHRHIPTNASRFVYDTTDPLAATIGVFPIRVSDDADVDQDVNRNGVFDSGIDVDGNGSGDLDSITYNEQGIFENNDIYEYDLDNDGDGIKEGVLLDLDFPMQADSSGVEYVPMWSFTVIDADGLINLNVHGNLAQVLTGNQPLGNDASTFYGDADFISASNQGLGPHEINPVWALNGRPVNESTGGDMDTSVTVASTFRDYRLFFGQNPRIGSAIANPANQWRELGNMELTSLKLGRAEYDSAGMDADDLFPGVWGEEDLYYQRFFRGSSVPYPRPGAALLDDNGNLHEGERRVPYFVHPLDFAGVGNPFTTNGKGLRVASVSGNRSRWQQYTQYTSNGNVRWDQTNDVGADLMVNVKADTLGDDPLEVVFDTENERSVDDILRAEDMAGLHMSWPDIDYVGLTSRVENLAPFNLEAEQPGANRRSYDIRRKFTTDSWDRTQFNLTINFDPDLWPTDPHGVREWEFTPRDATQALSGRNRLQFPPQFFQDDNGNGRWDQGAEDGVARYDTTLTDGNGEDPFRSEVRTLLEVELGNLDAPKYQSRLSVNELLWFNKQTQRLEFRQLTPHPGDPGAAAIPQPEVSDSDATRPYPPTTAIDQEYWARRDRQLLCRDIYVLLYTLCGAVDDVTTISGNAVPGYAGDNSINNTPNTGDRTLYTLDQLEQMAQFAVNLVDALDRDSVITRFEYDRDLSNGWDLDDNPYTLGDRIDGGTPNDDTDDETHEVFGVERQDLSFNEGLVIRTAEVSPGGHEATSYDDTEVRFFTFLELYNGGKDNITIGNERYRIEAVPDIGAPVNANIRRLKLIGNTTAVTTGDYFSIGSSSVDSGSADPKLKSAFLVDPNWTAGTPDFSNSTTWIAPNGRKLDLDAIGDTTEVELVDGSDTVATNPGLLTGGASGVGANYPTTLGTGTTIEFRLQRRANPGRTAPSSAAEEADNPYVTIDTFRVSATDVGDFTLATGDMDTTIQTKLQALLSRERPQPLFGGSLASNTTPGNAKNTLGTLNANAANPFDQLQMHFDRDFASPGELLHLSLQGPAEFTQQFHKAHRPSKVTSSGAAQVLAANEVPANLAGKVFLPNHPNTGTADVDAKTDNRWYRFFEFFEVPTRVHRNLGLGGPLELVRTPGKLNPNGIRHPEVLAALLDDRDQFDLFLTEDLDLDGTLDTSAGDLDLNNDAMLDTFEDLPLLLTRDTSDTFTNPFVTAAGTNFGTRDLYQSFLRSRDVQDTGVSGYFVPGLPGARPFRGFDTVTRTGATNGPDASLQDTLFREIAGATDRRNVFEVGSTANHDLGFIPPLARHRLLSKLMNNSTTRSHVFVVFVSVKFYKAARDGSGAIRIGEPLMADPGDPTLPEFDTPEHRGFFIIDRSDLERAGDPGNPSSFDYRALIKHRQIIE